MFKFGSIYNVILVLNVYVISAEISNKRLCADKECSVPISYAKTIMRYGSDDAKILSFAPNELVTIYSKAAGSRLDLWGAVINGKRGYVPKTHVQEHKISIANDKLTFTQDTEESISIGELALSPDPVKASYEVLDGTTVYLNNDVSSFTSTENTMIADNLNSKETDPLASKNNNHAEVISNDPTLIKHLDSENHGEESLVENVLSSLTNWINEGSGIELSIEEEEEVSGEDNKLIEIEDADENNDSADENNDSATTTGEDNVNTEYQSEKFFLTDPDIIKTDLTSSAKKPSNFQSPEHLIQQENPLNSQNNLDEIMSIQTPIIKSDNSNLVDSMTVEISSTEDSKPDTQEESVLTIESESKHLLPESLNLSTEELSIAQTELLQEKLEVEVVSVSSSTMDSKNEEIEKVDHFHDTQIQADNKHPSNTPHQMDSGIFRDKSIQHSEKILDTGNIKQQVQITNSGIQTSEETPELVPHETAKTDSEMHLPFNSFPFNTNKDILQDNLLNHIAAEKHKPADIIDVTEHHLSSTENPSVANLHHNISSNEEILNTTDNFAEPNREIPLQPSSINQHHDAPETYIPIQPPSFKQHHTELHQPLFSNININQDNENESFSEKDINTGNVISTAMHTELTKESLGGSSHSHNGGSVNNEDENNNKVNDAADLVLKHIEDNKVITETEANVWLSSVDKHMEENHNHMHLHNVESLISKSHSEDYDSCLANFAESDCPHDHFKSPLPTIQSENVADLYYFKLPLIAYETFLVLGITATTVVVFLWGYIYIDRSKKEVLLVAKINNLQKHFLVIKKENELLTGKLFEVENDNFNKSKAISDEVVEDLKFQLIEAETLRLSLEQQVQNLEKELENSTEVGLELNRMLSEFLNADGGSDTLIANIDQLQRQLIEQQGTINTYNETLNIRETENHELRLELEINNSRVNELQSELNKMALNLLKLEEDKEQLQTNYETDIATLKEQLQGNTDKFKSEILKISDEFTILKQKYIVSQRNLELKTSEYKLLKENINHFNNDNNNSDALKSMFDATTIKSELMQLKNENQLLTQQLQQESNRTSAFEKQSYLAMEDAQQLKAKYEVADQEKMEAHTKLEILSNYFKEREAQLQKELTKQESMWTEKQGETTSTIERIKYMQEELQNYKAQYESLKQEIVAQEVEMKSQISVLEKKAHENWVAARQAERKLEEAKQEAAQLRNRLTLRERNINEDKIQNRLVSPLEQNGDISLNDTGNSHPLMFGVREHLTKSPPLQSLPPFLPPPPGAPFMPPPLGGVHMPPPGFLPPPPSLIPGDHRPPPLGRMSSPPLNSRYSPDSRAYSGYSHNSPSPTSDDEYDQPVYRSYSPYSREDRRDFSRPPPPSINRNSTRNHRGTTHSSGSAHSNESLEKINRHNSKV